MKQFELLERMQRMNHLIRDGRTGTPSEFADRLGISTSHLFRCIQSMKELGMEIGYSRSLKSYYYKGDKELTIQYTMKIGHDHRSIADCGGIKGIK
ncbi:MAG: hypothetical protein LWW85_03970 [Marinilabiliales bacterium]|nr:hypothetical protein [Marinilabiliales bacterium]